MFYICRNCTTPLNLVSSPKESYLCKVCDQSYPIVNSIPILLKNPNSFLAKTIINNENLIRQQNNIISQLGKNADSDSSRSEILKKIKNGLSGNLELIKIQQNILLPFVNKEDIIGLIHNTNISLLYSGLEYLRRDWCWQEDGEKELKTILETIASYVEKHIGKKNKKALVIGAGAGRTAWDLCEVFDHVYAVDSSFCLVNYFYTLLKSNIKFYQISENNIYSTEDFAISREATLNLSEYSEKIKNINKFNFFVGDASHLFLSNESIEVITSIYFTDVLPFHILLAEVKRILKPGGLFIHFGPLSYHFSDMENSFSAEEIKEILKQNDFSIIEEAREVSPHTYSEIRMNMLIYNNWSFVAIKNNSSNSIQNNKLTYNSIINIKGKVSYDIKGFVSQSGNYESSVSISLFNGEIYEGSLFMLEVIKLSDNKSVLEIIGNIKEIYKNEVDIISDENIFNLINDLYLNEVLTIN